MPSMLRSDSGAPLIVYKAPSQPAYRPPQSEQSQSLQGKRAAMVRDVHRRFSEYADLIDMHFMERLSTICREVKLDVMSSSRAQWA